MAVAVAQASLTVCTQLRVHHLAKHLDDDTGGGDDATNLDDKAGGGGGMMAMLLASGGGTEAIPDTKVKPWGYFSMVTFGFVFIKPRLHNSLLEFLSGPCTTAKVDLKAADSSVRPNSNLAAGTTCMCSPHV